MFTYAKTLIEDGSEAVVPLASVNAVAVMNILARDVRKYVKNPHSGQSGEDIRQNATQLLVATRYARERCEWLFSVASQAKHYHIHFKDWAQHKIEVLRTVESWLLVLSDSPLLEEGERKNAMRIFGTVSELMNDSVPDDYRRDPPKPAPRFA